MSDNLRNTTPNTPHTNATPPEVMDPAGVIRRTRQYVDGMRVQVWIRKDWGWVISFEREEVAV